MVYVHRNWCGETVIKRKERPDCRPVIKKGNLDGPASQTEWKKIRKPHAIKRGGGETKNSGGRTKGNPPRRGGEQEGLLQLQKRVVVSLRHGKSGHLGLGFPLLFGEKKGVTRSNPVRFLDDSNGGGKNWRFKYGRGTVGA